MAVFCTNHVRGRARNYWKILTWVILEYLPVLYHLKGIWWMVFIVLTPSPPAQGWNYLFIPAITMYLGTGENELQVCMSSSERIPHTFKVKFHSCFISIMHLSLRSWEWQLEESKSHHSSWWEKGAYLWKFRTNSEREWYIPTSHTSTSSVLVNMHKQDTAV